MNGLLPIIRRVRRPLLPVDERAASVPLAPRVAESGVGSEPPSETPALAEQRAAGLQPADPREPESIQNDTERPAEPDQLLLVTNRQDAATTPPKKKVRAPRTLQAAPTS